MQLSPHVRMLLADAMAQETLELEAQRLACEPGGCILARTDNGGEARGAMISLDPGGGWRVTHFDADGLDPRHVCCCDKYAAALLALREGYTDSDRGLLKRLRSANLLRFNAHLYDRDH